MPLVNLLATDDTTVSSAHPDYNYDGDGFLQAGWDGNGAYLPSREFCYAWMKFDLSSIPAGSTINSAFLTNIFFFPITMYANFDVTFYRIKAEYTWLEYTLTWNTQPPWDTGESVSFTVDEDSASSSFEQNINVTTHVQNAFAENDGAVVWRVGTVDSFEGQASGISLSDHEYGQGRPWLQVVYTTPGGARRRANVAIVD